MKKSRYRTRKHSSFWVGPLIAGGFIAIGYGTTKRLIVLKGDWHKPVLESFKKERPFPGTSLQQLRIPHQDSKVIISSNMNRQLSTKKSFSRREFEKELKERRLQDALKSLQPISEDTYSKRSQSNFIQSKENNKDTFALKTGLSRENLNLLLKYLPDP